MLWLGKLEKGSPVPSCKKKKKKKKSCHKCCDRSPLLCCKRHDQPAAKVGLPRHALGLQQPADDLGLESYELCWDVHKGYNPLLQGPRRDGPAGE